MSAERTVLTPSGVSKVLTSDDADKASEAALKMLNLSPTEEERQAFRSKIVSVYSRGILQDKLYVPLPEGLTGQWVPNDSVSIADAKVFGFEEDTEYGIKSAMHNDGSGRVSIGDTIFMVAPTWKVQEMQKARDEKFYRMHGFKNGGHTQREEQQFLSTGDGVIGTYAESNASPVNVSKTTM